MLEVSDMKMESCGKDRADAMSEYEMVTEKFRHPVHFICPADRMWPELGQTEASAIPNLRLAQASVDGLDCWINRTFYEFRKAGLDVSIAPDHRPDAINIAPVREYGRKLRLNLAFVVVPRLDAHRPMLANFRIAQNFLSPATAKSGNVLHWPQPAIIRRDPARGNQMTCVAFKGSVVNLDPAFCSKSFQKRLDAIGVRLRFDLPDTGDGALGWHDYSDCDAIIAVRNLTHYDSRFKPASKLVNAWFGEVPAILGPEPAFRELRKNEFDYLEVTSPHEALQAIGRLKTDPSLRNAIVANGLLRQKEFSLSKLIGLWVDLINGPISRRFEDWSAATRVRKSIVIGGMIALEPFSKRYHHFRALHGHRVLDD